MHFIVELFANNLGQEILLDVTNPTIVSYTKIVGFGTGYLSVCSIEKFLAIEFAVEKNGAFFLLKL